MLVSAVGRAGCRPDEGRRRAVHRHVHGTCRLCKIGNLDRPGGWPPVSLTPSVVEGAVMAEKRKSATKTAARERAREAAAARIEREQKIMEASEEFFAKTLRIDQEREQTREKISALQDRLKELSGPVPEAAGPVIRMKELGLANREIAELLELSTASVAAYNRLARSESAESAPAAGESEESAA